MTQNPTRSSPFIELLCRDCHICWLKDQDRERINKLQSEMLQKVAHYIETSEVREGEIMATKERVSERNSRVYNCSLQLSKINVAMPSALRRLDRRAPTEQVNLACIFCSKLCYCFFSQSIKIRSTRQTTILKFCRCFMRI